MLKLFNSLTLILQAFNYNLKLKVYKTCLKIKSLIIIIINNIKITFLFFKFILINIVNKNISFIINNN